jgi:hypothetical protein
MDPSHVKQSTHPPFPRCLRQCNPSSCHSAGVRCLPQVVSSMLTSVLRPFSHLSFVFSYWSSLAMHTTYSSVLLQIHPYCSAATPTPFLSDQTTALLQLPIADSFTHSLVEHGDSEIALWLHMFSLYWAQFEVLTSRFARKVEADGLSTNCRWFSQMSVRSI